MLGHIFRFFYICEFSFIAYFMQLQLCTSLLLLKLGDNETNLGPKNL